MWYKNPFTSVKEVGTWQLPEAVILCTLYFLQKAYSLKYNGYQKQQTLQSAI